MVLVIFSLCFSLALLLRQRSVRLFNTFLNLSSSSLFNTFLNLSSSSFPYSPHSLSSRDRNREHARNTRLRKKAYIEKLRETLHSLSDEKEKADRNIKVSVARVVEQQAVRKNVLQCFFLYRARGELDRYGFVFVHILQFSSVAIFLCLGWT